jgi:predicted metal-dependent peptidase
MTKIMTDEELLNLPPDEMEAVITHHSEAERWSYLITTMSLNDNFIHEFLMIMSKYANESIKTMGVRVIDNTIKLCYAPSFLNRLYDSEARWCLVHEVLHVVFHHCTIRQSSDPSVARLHNIAADMAINQLIPNDNGAIKKPRKEIIEPYFPEMYSFPPKLSMEQYFQLLLQRFDPNQPPPQGQGDDGEGGESGGNKDDKDDKDESPDGSDDGKEDDKSKDHGNGKGQGKPDPLDKGDLVDNHEGWSDQDAGLIESIVRDTIQKFKESGQKWGQVTGSLEEMIMAAQRGQIKWWRVLREQLGHLISSTKTTTLKRPNRRFGYPYPGTQRKHVDKILVCGDSSVSVSDKSWNKFLAELNLIAETNPVDFVVFDTKITYGPKAFRRRIRKFNVPGRGGTSFDEIFELAVKGKYKSMVILTDGAAPAVEYPRGVKDIVWCIVQNGKPPVDWGKVVHVREILSMSLIS